MLSFVPQTERASTSVTDTDRNMRKEPGVLFVFSALFLASIGHQFLCPPKLGQSSMYPLLCHITTPWNVF